MKKEFIWVASISAGLILLVPYLLQTEGPSAWTDYAEVAGVFAFFIGLLWLLVGLILILIRSSRNAGQAFLWIAAILLFLSFTLFNAGDGLLKIMFKDFKPPSA